MKKTLCFAAVSAGALLSASGVASAQEARPPAGRPPTPDSHTVAAGESLSDIARAQLGAPERWVDIFELNRDTLASPEVIQVGQVLVVPVPPVAVPAAPAPATVQEAPPAAALPPRPHTIEAGESLSRISQTELGTPNRWVEIFALNLATLPNPELIEVGRVIDIPSSPVAVPADLLASLAAASAPAPAPAAVSAPASSRQPVTAARTGSTVAPSAPSGGGAGGSLAAIRACESGGSYTAVSPSGQYRGAYQFDLQTWQSVGGSGDPAAASPGEQDARAAALQSQRGSNPWPVCG